MSLHQLRPYQLEAVKSVKAYLDAKPGNPCVVLPTGAGKTHVIAALIEWVVGWNGRVLVLSHVKELLEQTHAKTLAHCPGLDIGLHSASLKRRDTKNQVIVAGIQSVAKLACQMGPFDLIIIDEAHLIPPDGEGRYQTFLTAAKVVNPRVRIVGLTATPYRTTTGMICGEENILNEICYEAEIAPLIAEGWLCPLKTRSSKYAVDSSRLHVRKGDFIEKEVENLFIANDLVADQTREIIELCKDRQGVLVFAASIHHGELLRAQFVSMGQRAEAIFGKTPKEQRSLTIQAFREGQFKYLINRDVLTTGFDATHIDAVCMLRCTYSPGLYAQMVGRGFRPDPRKNECIVVDYGQNIERHGPIDAIDPTPKEFGGGGGGRSDDDDDRDFRVKVCPACQYHVPSGVMECHNCHHNFPPKPVKVFAVASGKSILSGKIVRHQVYQTRYSVHTKDGADVSSMKVEYVVEQGDFFPKTVCEWVCFEHEGWPRDKACRWWTKRSHADVPELALEAVAMARQGCLSKTEWIEVISNAERKYPDIVTYGIGKKPIALPSVTLDSADTSRPLNEKDFAF